MLSSFHGLNKYSDFTQTVWRLDQVPHQVCNQLGQSLEKGGCKVRHGQLECDQQAELEIVPWSICKDSIQRRVTKNGIFGVVGVGYVVVVIFFIFF